MFLTNALYQVVSSHSLLDKKPFAWNVEFCVVVIQVVKEPS